jgi:hypothetical protein
MSHLFRLVTVDRCAEQEKNKLDLAHSSADFVLAHLVKCHPQFTLTERFVSKIPKQWKNCILGKLDRSSLRTFYVPNLDELKHRITKSLDYGLERKRTTPSSHLFCADTGKAWQKPRGNDDFDINAFYLKSCSQFPEYLRNLLQEKGTTLDKLAGVEPSSRHPEIEQVVRDACAAAQTRGVESHDMFLEDGTTLGGSILALHNGCLSAEWLASYLVDTDNNSFMEDCGAKALHGTARLLRVCSNYHTVETPPWFQMGEHNSAYLYLSQSASAAKTGWLRIASYLIKLEIDHITFQLSKIPGTKKYWLDPEEHVIDASVIALGHPSDSSFKLHTDLRNGLTDPTEPGCSQFFLQVPTLAIASFMSKSSHVSWFLNGAALESKPSAVISQDFLTVHFQMMAVQFNFKHKVCRMGCSSFHAFINIY